MSYKLDLEKYVGKVAVVTGASAGIGKVIVEELVKHGVVVAALARRLERLEEIVKQLSGKRGKVYPYKCDVTNQQDIISTFKKIASELGPIHILINNAGMARVTTIIDGDIDKWRSTLDTNVLGAAICIREAVSVIKSFNIKGHIININSMAGQMVPDIKMLNMYTASKHALKALTETVRLEINREKLPIKITSISPATVTTEFLDAAFEGKPVPEGALKADQVALTSEDVTATITYVLSTPDHVNVKEVILTPQGVYY